MQDRETSWGRTGSTDYATRFFISHSSADGREARILATFLRRSMGAVWHIFNSADLYTLYAGDSWEKTVTESLGIAHGFILLMSESAIKSGWVAKELELARSSRKPIFPVCVGGWNLDPVPAPFTNLRPRRLDDRRGIKNLLHELRTLHGEVQRLPWPLLIMFVAMTELGNLLYDDLIRQLRNVSLEHHAQSDGLDPSGLSYPTFEEYVSFTADSVPTSNTVSVIYHHQDGDIATLTAAFLRRGLGGEWRVTTKLVPEADCVVLLLSSTVVGDSALLESFQHAQAGDVPILPLLYAGMSNRELPDVYARLQTRRLDEAEHTASVLFGLRTMRRTLQGLSDYKWELLDRFRGRNDEEISRIFVGLLTRHLRETGHQSRSATA